MRMVSQGWCRQRLRKRNIYAATWPFPQLTASKLERQLLYISLGYTELFIAVSIEFNLRLDEMWVHVTSPVGMVVGLLHAVPILA